MIISKEHRFPPINDWVLYVMEKGAEQGGTMKDYFIVASDVLKEQEANYSPGTLEYLLDEFLKAKKLELQGDKQK